MAYQNLDTNMGKDSLSMLKEVKEFTTKIMRPMGIELDLLSDSADVIKKDSVLWEVYKTHRKLELHLLNIPNSTGGMAEDIDPITSLLITERMGYADTGLATGLGVSSMPFQYAAKFQVPELEQMARDYCEDKECNMVGCWAINDPDENGSKNSSSVRAVQKGDEYIANGELKQVSNGTIATHAVFTVDLESSDGKNGSGLANIPLDLPGISRGTPLDRMGQRPLNLGSIIFKDVQIPKAYIIADDSSGIKLSKMFVTEVNGNKGIIFAGLSMAAYDEAFEYSKKRIQGGVPIFEHKNIKLQLFKMFKIVEAARANAHRIAKFNNENPDNPSLAHAVASKCLSTETAAKVIDEAIQIFGGNGLAREYPLEKMFRDTRAGMVEDGVNDFQGLSVVKYL